MFFVFVGLAVVAVVAAAVVAAIVAGARSLRAYDE